MSNHSLDYKVFGRDSVFIAAHDAGLGSWLSSIFKKVTHLIKKIVNATPGISLLKHTGIYRVLKRYEHKHRNGIKKFGAIVATAAGGYFLGPVVSDFVSGLGGSTIAAGAASKITKSIVGTAIQKSMTPEQIARKKQEVRNWTPAQILADPELAALSQQIAAAEAAKGKYGELKTGAQILGVEGANEIQHAAQKEKTRQDMIKYGIPAAMIAFGIIL